jgi:hypothetical protein
MRHRNKAHRPAIAPGHRRIRDFSRSYRVVYGPGRQLRASLADIATGAH